MDTRNAHPTKVGPGRRHGHKVKHGRKPAASSGAGRGFMQHKNPARNEQRELVKTIGIRQVRRQRYAARAA